MARKVRITMTDDLDGGAADETVAFGIDGRAYEIDLSERNAAELRGALRAYMRCGRRLRPGKRRRAAPTAHDRERSVAIRAWARGAGIDVKARGRIPAAVVDRYEAAHPDPAHPDPAHPDAAHPGRPRAEDRPGSANVR